MNGVLEWGEGEKVAAGRRPLVNSDEGLPFVIPAKAGIHFDFVFVCVGALSREPAHVHVSSIDVPVDRLLSFACPKESRQRKGHPRGRGRRASLPVDSASRLRGLPTARPCTDGKLAGILPAIAARLFLHLLAATWREPGKSRARQSLPQKKRQRQGATAHNSSSPRRRGPSALAFGFGFSSFAFGSLCEAAKVGWKRPRAPHAGRARTARLWRQGRSPAAKPQPTAANRPLRGRRVTEGAFLWLLSLCKQRK
jgi:hypothetical protein